MADKAALLTPISMDENGGISPDANPVKKSLLTPLFEVSTENNAVNSGKQGSADSGGLLSPVKSKALLRPIEKESTPTKPVQLLRPLVTDSEQLVVDAEPAQPGPLLAPIALDTQAADNQQIETNKSSEAVEVVAFPSDVEPAPEPVALTAESTSAPSPEVSITPFQYATYLSFVTAFIFAGFAAVILFRKAVSFSAERLMSAAHIFALGCGIFMLHGFFNTYLYTIFVQGTRESLPLTFSFAAWIIISPLSIFVLGKALAVRPAPGAAKLPILAILSCIASLGATLAVLGSFAPALVMTLALGALGLSLSSAVGVFLEYSKATARNSELCGRNMKMLVIALTVIPVLSVVMASLSVFGLGGEVVQLLLNFLVSVFALSVGYFLIQSAKFEPVVEPSAEPVAEAVADVVADVVQVDEEPQPEESTKEVAINGVPESVAPRKKKVPVRDLPQPPAPVRAGVNAPNSKFSTGVESAPAAPNAPAQIKAPVKPKKRF